MASRLINWAGHWNGFGKITFPSPTTKPFSVEFEDEDENDDESEILTFVIGPAKPKDH